VPGDDRTVRDSIPAELLLAGYPDPMVDIAERLREVVRSAVPEATEAVRPRWRLIGYNVPIGRRSIFFAWVGPETKHVHLGFHYGVFMDDPEGVLEGAGITKLARWLTFVPGDSVRSAPLGALLDEAARVARMTPAERFSLMLERDAR